MSCGKSDLKKSYLPKHKWHSTGLLHILSDSPSPSCVTSTQQYLSVFWDVFQREKHALRHFHMAGICLDCIYQPQYSIYQLQQPHLHRLRLHQPPRTSSQTQAGEIRGESLLYSPMLEILEINQSKTEMFYSGTHMYRSSSPILWIKRDKLVLCPAWVLWKLSGCSLHDAKPSLKCSALRLHLFFGLQCTCAAFRSLGRVSCLLPAIRDRHTLFAVRFCCEKSM